MSNLKTLRDRVRVHGRDFNNTIFRTSDIDLFINEGIDRIIQIMPQLSNIPYLVSNDDIVQIIPREYAHMLSVYSVSRLMAQDERHYEATAFMNEFETKLAELFEKVANGDVVLTDPETGKPIDISLPTDHVVDNYFYDAISGEDIDDGVEGL